MALEGHAPRPGTTQRRSARVVLETLRERPEAGALAAAAAIFLVFTFWTGDTFVTRDGAASTLNVVAELAVVALPVTLLMIAGEFDLSVGSMLGFSSMIAPYLMTHSGLPTAAAIAVALLVAVTIGALNGLGVVVTRIPSFIVTLGALLFWRGVLLVVTEGFPLTVPTDALAYKLFSYRFDAGLLAGFNVSVIWFLALAGVLSYLLTQTLAGNWIYAAGGNETAARASGVRVDRVRLLLFMGTGFAAGLAGTMQAGRFDSVDALRGQNLELEAIAAAVIGGARLTGGYGSVTGTVLGCLIIGMIRTGLSLAGVTSYWYSAIIGLLIVGAVVVNQLVGRDRPGR